MGEFLVISFDAINILFELENTVIMQSGYFSSQL